MLKREISQSQITLFMDCPYAYAMRYKFKKEPMFYDPSIMLVGKAVHDSIDKYYKYMYEKDTTAEDIIAKTYYMLRKKWDTKLPNSDILLHRAYTCLSNFAKYELENIKVGVDEKPLSELILIYDDMIGIIDVFYEDKKIVRDFKTNTKASVTQNFKIQAAMYKYLLEKAMNISVDSFDFIFLSTYENKMISLTNENYSDLLDIILYEKQAIKKAWENDCFEKKPKTNHMCKYCQYNYYCGGIQ